MISNSEWSNLKPYTKYKARRLSDGAIVRIALYGDDYNNGFEYAKGKKRRGYIRPAEVMQNNYTLIETDETEAWHKRLNRAIKAMKKSGLWEHILEMYTNLLGMTYQDKETLTQLYWQCELCRYNSKIAEIPTEDFNREFSKVFAYYLLEYPFIFETADDGRLKLNTDYIFELSDCQLKTMYFGDYNKEFKQNIKAALESKRSYKLPFRVRTSYDVSFSYDAEQNRAIYGEEYCGSGNGHYYLALNENVALFYEND